MSNATLPSKARYKLTAIEQAADLANATATFAVNRISDLQKSLALNPSETDDDARVHEIAGLKQNRIDQQMRHKALAGLVSSIRYWLQNRPGLTFMEASPVVPHREKNETIKQAVDRVRDEVAATQHHLRVVQAAPLPKPDLRAAAQAQVKALVEKGRPNLVAGRDGLIVEFQAKGAVGSLLPAHVAAWLAWLDPVAMEKRLLAEIDAMPEPTLALPAAEKAARIDELTGNVEQLERLEEALIEMALDSGQFILRRPNASPLAVLGLKIKQRVKIAAKAKESEAA